MGGLEQKKTGVLHTALIVLVGAILTLGIWATPAYADECPAGGEHTYSAVIITYPTEDEDGIRNYTCTKCSYSIDLPIPAVGHEWGPWIVDLEPTCTSEGHQYRKCSKYPDWPHYEEELIPLLSATWEHSYSMTEEVLPTCLEPGHRIYACQICGDTYQEELPSLGHEWGVWTTEHEPTVGVEGSKKRVCLHDATHVEYTTIPALEEKEEIVETSSTQTVAAVDGGEEEVLVPDFYFRFGLFDTIFVAADVLLIGIALFLMIPFLVRLRWAQKKRESARAKRSQKHVEPELDDWSWWM